MNEEIKDRIASYKETVHTIYPQLTEYQILNQVRLIWVNNEKLSQPIASKLHGYLVAWEEQTGEDVEKLRDNLRKRTVRDIQY